MATTTLRRNGNTTGARDASALRIASAASQEVDALLVGKEFSTTAHVFEGITANYTGSTFTRNTNLWCGSSIAAQLTGVHMQANQKGAAQLITPRHAITAGHYLPNPIGSTIKYVDFDNTVRTTSVSKLISDNPATGQANFSDTIQPKPDHLWDFALILLADEMPSTIHVPPVLSITQRQQTAMAEAHAPILYLSQGGAANGSTPKNRKLCVSEMDWFTEPTDPKRAEFYHLPVSGDSGGVTYLLVDGVIYLHGLQSLPIDQANVDYLNSLIVRADAAAGISTGYTVTVATDPTL